MFNGKELLLNDVRYIPELKRNLISVGMFDILGYSTNIKNGIMTIINKDDIIVKGIKRNGLYNLEGFIIIAQASVASSNLHSSSRIWHKGKLSYQNRICLMVTKLKNWNFVIIVFSESKRGIFGASQHNTSRPFEYVHSNLWGPDSVSASGDVAVTTVYLINRCPSSAIGFKTPIEMWNGKPTDYSNLKVFGSLAFAHTSASNNNDESVRIKLEPPEDQKINHEDITNTSLDDNVSIETDLAIYNLVRDRERRVIKPPTRYGEAYLNFYALSVDEDLQRDEPRNYREAINSEDKEAWMITMN
ncbi:uncharacterized protein [Cicer arietinum]|uniref:uncharacterized protein n=1 Tax=Cicer arietinum TaxID=3827 RepID=UPI003CC60149